MFSDLGMIRLPPKEECISGQLDAGNSTPSPYHSFLTFAATHLQSHGDLFFRFILGLINVLDPFVNITTLWV